jgi:hypothetical protein
MTRMKSVLLAGVLALASLTVANAKSYEIEIHEPTRAGKVQLKPGIYTLAVQGDSAVFTDHRRQSFTTPVKLENGNTKFKSTTVDSTTDHIRYIELGGSNTRLEFIE